MKKRSPLIEMLFPFAVVSLAFLAGCTKSDPPRFRLNMFEIAGGLSRQGLTLEQQQTVADVLLAMYGTPDEPFVLPETHLNLEKIRLAAGPVWSDQHGTERGLFRQHCVHCHGVTGDGAGPTAAILNPYPRDYRPGKFKFKSTECADMPTDADLKRILRQGIPDTAMPSFALLPNDEIEALVEYVKYLSMRGQTELGLIVEIADLNVGDKLPLNREVLVDTILADVASKWAEAPDKVINPPEKPQSNPQLLGESIAAGRMLFYDANKTTCAKCHGPSALGDGQTGDFDDWTKPAVDLAKELESLREAGKLDEAQAFKARVLAGLPLPPRNILPRNLRQGVYRGGRRPLDLYRRLYAGINGVPMPAVGPTAPGGKGTLTPEQIWNLVDYVLSLPYEPISKPARQTASTAPERL